MGQCCSKEPTSLPNPHLLTKIPPSNPNYRFLPNKMKSTEWRVESVGGSGLKNLGNTCFVNSVIQCIINTQPLLDYFLSHTYKEHLIDAGCFSSAMAHIMEKKWLFGGAHIRPDSLITLIWQSGLFYPRLQHDAHEFLEFFLEQLHNELNRAGKLKRRPYVKGDVESETKAASWWGQYLACNSSIIVDLFVGQLRSLIKCLECNYIKTSFEKFSVLSLPIPSEKPDLEKCLKEFTSQELLTEQNKWNCPNCLKKVCALKKYDIWKVPPILIIQFKRFQFNKTGSGKLAENVQYPLQRLDMGQFVEGPQKETSVYDLYAKIDHTGVIDFGHYTAFALNVYTHEWSKFSDSEVTRASAKDLLSRHSYVLFYQKVSVDGYTRQSVDMPELWPHKLDKMRARRASQVSEDEAYFSCDSFVSTQPLQRMMSKGV